MKKVCRYCGQVVKADYLGLVKHTDKNGELCKGSRNISAAALSPTAYTDNREAGEADRPNRSLSGGDDKNEQPTPNE